MDLCTLTENGFLNPHTISTKNFGNAYPHYQHNRKKARSFLNELENGGLIMCTEKFSTLIYQTGRVH